MDFDSVTSLLLASAVVGSGYLFYKIEKRFGTTSGGEDSQAPSCSVLRSEAYQDQLARVQAQWSRREYLPLSEFLQAQGQRGEAKVLAALEHIGQGVFYWNVGMNSFRKKAEYDVLALTRAGVLHVEVKSFNGEWRPGGGLSKLQPAKWEKAGDRGLVSVKSPITQALRSQRLLENSLGIVCRKDIPVTSVVVFTDSSVRLMDIEDKRLPLFVGMKAFISFARDFAAGVAVEGSLSDHNMAKIVAYMGSGNIEPAFFDPALAHEGPADSCRTLSRDDFREQLFGVLGQLGLKEVVRPPEGYSNFFVNPDTLNPNRLNR